MNIIAYIVLVIASGFAGLILSFAALISWRSFDTDPTVGGAYAAMFLLSAIPVFAASAALAAYLFRGFLS